MRISGEYKMKRYKSYKHSLKIYVVSLAVLVFAGIVLGDIQKVVLDANGEHSYFGWDVALSERYAIVSAANESNEFGSAAGAVYAYELVDGEWNNVQRLTAPDAAANAFFGHAIAMDSSVAVISAVGSFANGPFSGCAYIYRRQGGLWNFEQKITPNDGAPIARFGQSVDVNGDLILVGAYQAFGAAPGSGAAYVFKFENDEWTQQDKLVASEGARDDFFGWSVALNDNGAALVGAYSAKGAVEKSGAAYLFEEKNGEWAQTAKLFAGDGSERDLFSYSLDLTNDHALIGAYQYQQEGVNCGAAYMFHFDGESWQQRHFIQHTEKKHHDYFGIEVRINDKIAAVSASRVENDDDADEGAVYLFDYTNEEWNELEKLTPEDGAAHDHFGLALAMFGANVLVGARLNDNNNVNDGAAYFSNPGALTSVEQSLSIPKVFALHQNYPNPFNPTTTIKFDLPEPAYVTLTIYDVLGHEVHRLASKKYAAGYHEIVWDGMNAAGRMVSSGLYVYKITAGERVVSKKMMFVK
jgi:hypothetical protein